MMIDWSAALISSTRVLDAVNAKSAQGMTAWEVTAVAWCARATARSALKQAPQELIVDFVVKLHFRRFHHIPKQARTPIRGRSL